MIVSFYTDRSIDLMSHVVPTRSSLQGAFVVAQKAKVPVVPITLLGTYELMPNGKEACLYPGGVKIVVHPRVMPKSAGAMMDEARAAIASALPEGGAVDEDAGDISFG